MDLDMGQYGFYVWGCYGATFVALTVLAIASLRARSANKKKLDALQDALKDTHSSIKTDT
jgi:heme exporter protein D